MRKVSTSPGVRPPSPECVREEAVVPLPGVGVEHAVQRLLGDGLGVDHVSHALDTLQTLQGLGTAGR